MPKRRADGRRRSAMVITVTLALLAGATAALWPQTVGAAGYNPVPNTSWGTNGENRAAVLHGGTLYVGGAFRRPCRAGPHWPARTWWRSTPRPATRSWASPPTPTAASRPWRRTALGCTSVGPSPPSRASAGRTWPASACSTGRVDPAFAPAPNSTVYDLWVHGDRLYVGGDFTSISGQTRQRVAAFNLQTTGSLVPGFAPSVNRRIFSVATSPDGRVVYVGGRFTAIGGTSFSYLAALDPTNGIASSRSTSSAWSRRTRRR